MTTRVTSAPEKAPVAPKIQPSAPAAVAPRGKTFNHVLGQARTHSAKGSAKTAVKQSQTSKTTAVKGQQTTEKSSGGKGKSTTNGDASTGRAPVKKQATTDDSLKAKTTADQNESAEAEDTEQTPVVKDQEQSAKDQHGDQKKDGLDQRQSQEEKAKQDKSQADSAALQAQLPGNSVPVTTGASAGKSSGADSGSGVAKVADLNAVPRTAQRGDDGSAIATNGNTPTGDATAAGDAAAGATDTGLPDESAEASETPPVAAHAAPAAAGRPDESATVNPAIGNGQDVKSAVAHSATAAAVARPAAQEYQFADANHGNIVSGIHGQLFPNGGTMQIRLDPPELGPLHITVKIENGVLSATFQTSNDQASKLLSHSLVDLKQTLEGQGMAINRLHVEQSVKPETSNGKSGNDSGARDESQGQGEAQGRGSEQDQQRREMLQRMWRRIAGGGDPLDLVA